MPLKIPVTFLKMREPTLQTIATRLPIMTSVAIVPAFAEITFTISEIMVTTAFSRLVRISLIDGGVDTSRPPKQLLACGVL
ncbi:hypothetical protein KEJ27_09810 [Candidatus Bathyarchaeota archaeon]|nr:hypothetical protein [Candidatus Bathyarchaeota archaeon]